MKKFIKWFISLAAIGTIFGLIIAWFSKDKQRRTDDSADDFTEEEDFDLDSDLQPVSERGYVPLNSRHTSAQDESASASQTEAESDSKDQDTDSQEAPEK